MLEYFIVALTFFACGFVMHIILAKDKCFIAGELEVLMDPDQDQPHLFLNISQDVFVDICKEWRKTVTLTVKHINRK